MGKTPGYHHHLIQKVTLLIYVAKFTSKTQVYASIYSNYIKNSSDVFHARHIIGVHGNTEGKSIIKFYLKLTSPEKSIEIDVTANFT